MFAKILAFLLIASPLMAVNVWVDTLRDTSFTSDLGRVYDTFIKSGDDSVRNKSTNGVAELDGSSRPLIRMGDIRSIIGNDRRIEACTLVFQTAENILDPNKGGRLALHQILVDWEKRPSTMYRTGALWRYSFAPMYPDTTPQASLPTYFSWQDSALDTDAKDQLSCGSCYAHSAAGAFETAAKIQGVERQLGYNSGNGTGADRSIAPFDTVNVTSTGWKVFNISPLELWRMYTAPDSEECGIVLLRMAGEYTINTTENANTSYRPKIFVNYEIDSLGQWEEQKSITGTTNLSDVGLFRDADSTVAHGTDTSFTFSATNNTYLLKINDVRGLFGDSVSKFASSYCSVYVKVKTTDGYMNVLKPFKKWVENEATGTIWKTGYRWHSLSAGFTNELDASEQQLLNCGGFTCFGGTQCAALEHWRINGVFSEEQYPYKNTDTLTCADTAGSSLSTRLTWWWYTPHATIAQLKQSVLIRPVTAAIELYSNFSGYQDGCFVGENLSATSGHAVVIIGWDDSLVCGNTIGAWHVRNSWGEEWGEYGRGWLAYDTNACLAIGPPSSLYGTPETIEEPTTWSSAGMAAGVDYSTNPVATVDITGGSGDVYKVAIPAKLVHQWYSNPSTNYGLVIKPYYDMSLPAPDTARTYIGMSGPTSGRPPDQDSPYFIIKSSDATTNIGNTKIGNVKIGR